MAVYREVHTTTAPADDVPVTPRNEYRMNVAARIIYLVGGILIAILAIRFLLAALGANPANGFANFIYTISHPFAAPFFSLFSYDQTLGRSRFEIGTLVAMAIYALVTAILARLATIGSRRPA
jgi:YggT family protein